QVNFRRSRVSSALSLTSRVAFTGAWHVVDGAPVYTQPSTGSQLSCVQVIPSSHATVEEREHAPLPLQWSTVQTFASSSHGVDVGAKPFAGHGCPATPVHSSATSQTSAAGRQTVPAGWTTFAGHAAPGMPVQFS